MLMEKLRADYLEARKARDEIRSQLLSALVGEAAMIGKNAGNRETTDEEALRVIKKFLDNAKETRRLLASQDADAAMIKVASEIAILDAYMPAQLDEARLRSLIEDYTKNNEGANLGVVMKHLQANYAGQYDGKLASQVAKQVLG